MEGLGVAANVIAVIDLTAKATSACAAYLKAVKNAKTDIERLQGELRNLDVILHGAEKLVKGKDGSKLQTMGQLKGALSDASSQLQKLIVKLEGKQGKTRKAMSHFGFRALKWPFESAEVASIIQNMERNRNSISAALVIDNTALQVETHSTVQEISSNVQRINLTLDISKIPVVKGAAFDSHTNEHDPKCLPNTRVELRQTITTWAEDTDSDTIFWLNGMAGTGKSTISRTVAHSFAQKKMLGASFFFKRRERDRGSASRLFTTIASQLINRLPEIGPSAIKAIEDEPDLPNKFIQEQFEKLILNPLHEAEKGVSSSRILILVIDALDECDRVADVRLIVNILARLKSLNKIKLKAFVTSRPELPIRLGFNTIQGEYKDLILHEIPKPVIEHDISEFLHHQLEQARIEYNSQSDPSDQLGPDWPGTQATDALIQMAVPLFIFAATMCRFIQDPFYDPVTQLEKVLKYKSSAQDSEMEKLDTTYRPTLDQLLVDRTGRAKERVLKDFREIVGTIVLLQEPLSISTLSCLVDIPERVISGILRPLHSVLSVPISPQEPIRMLHLSFHDFLVDKEMHEADPFWVDEQETHERLATRCLDLLRSGKHLKHDICDLGLPGTRRADIEQRQVNLKLSGEVRYACLYWTHHLEGSGLKIDDSHPVFSFLKDYFLFWLEALAILGEVHNCSAMIASIQPLVDHGSGLSSFLQDATQFVNRLDTIIDECPLQIYASGLPFAPEESIVKTAFRNYIPKWITQLPQTPQHWDASLRVIETSLDFGHAICFLPDSRSLQTFSKDGAVQVWDTMTGKQIDSIDADGEQKMRFSSDGEYSLSTNKDNSIVFWGSLTGGSQHPSEQRILDLTLSPDGKVAACTLMDGTVLVLDGREGQVRERLYAQDGSWMSKTDAALSRDRLAIVVNMKMRIWDLNSEGEPLEFQVDPPTSGISFSPDGGLIAYAHGSRVSVHDARTGKLLQTLGPCTADISVIAFAADGRHLASASGRRINLWHLETGKEVHRFEHPGRVVEYMAFSPDSGFLAASSPLDNMIQIWHQTAQYDADSFKEHGGGLVRQLALSRDRERAAALLDDKSVEIWDIDTAQSIKTIAYPVHDGVIRHKEENYSINPASAGVNQVSFPKTQEQNHVWVVSGVAITSMSLSGEISTDYLYTKEDGLSHKAVFSLDGKMVALSYSDTIKIWDLLAREMRHMLTAKKTNTKAFDFSPDSKLLVSMIESEEVIIWDLTSGRIKQSLSVGRDGQERRSVVALSLHDSTLALAWSSGAEFWDTNTGACLSTISLDGSFFYVSFDTTGTRLVTERGDIKLPPLHCGDSGKAVPLLGFEGYGLTDDFAWITWKSRRLIWLPPSYRPSVSDRRERVASFTDSTVILGTVSGSVCILKLAETPPWETRDSQSPSG